LTNIAGSYQDLAGLDRVRLISCHQKKRRSYSIVPRNRAKEGGEAVFYMLQLGMGHNTFISSFTQEDGRDVSRSPIRKGEGSQDWKALSLSATLLILAYVKHGLWIKNKSEKHQRRREEKGGGGKGNQEDIPRELGGEKRQTAGFFRNLTKALDI